MQEAEQSVFTISESRDTQRTPSMRAMAGTCLAAILAAKALMILRSLVTAPPRLATAPSTLLLFPSFCTMTLTTVSGCCPAMASSSGCTLGAPLATGVVAIMGKSSINNKSERTGQPRLEDGDVVDKCVVM